MSKLTEYPMNDQSWWLSQFDTRQQQLIANCCIYAANEPAGLPGHQLMLIIDKLTDLLIDSNEPEPIPACGAEDTAALIRSARDDARELLFKIRRIGEGYRHDDISQFAKLLAIELRDEYILTKLEADLERRGQ